MNTTLSFLPGKDVNITCSIPDTSVIWSSPEFESVALVNTVQNNETRLDGAIVFSLVEVVPGPPPCATTTATIADIQESMQGLSLTCTDGLNSAMTVIIDVVGKY